MSAGGDNTRRRAIVAGLSALVLVIGVSACGSSGSDAAESTTTAPATSAPGTDPDGGTTTAAGGTSTTGSAPATSTTALADASEAQRTAPGDGTGTALLEAVRVGRNEGFERIVFQFAGSSMPGYRVQWVDGPITADGSGEPVEVTGDAYLEMVFQPASGVDLSAPQLTIIYDGPDRIPVTGQTKLITDLVRTGDFEAVLSWVAGTSERVPFRVLTLTNPTRIAIDLVTR